MESVTKKKERTKSSLNTESTRILPRELRPCPLPRGEGSQGTDTLGSTVPAWAQKLVGSFKYLTGTKALSTLTKRSIKIFKNT